MKAILTVALVAGVAVLSACTSTERRTAEGAALGAAAGGVIGAVATGTAEGALTGAAIGAASGAFIAYVTDKPGWCIYEDRYGRRYEARCRRR